MNRVLIVCVFSLIAAPSAPADDDAPPRIFLDKSARIVEYQLKRLSNSKLLLVETATDDPKYLPVFKAVLVRPGLSRKDRDEALYGMSTINNSSITAELLATLGTLDAGDRAERQIGQQLIDILVSQPPADLVAEQDALTAASNESSLLQTAGLAGLITAGAADKAWQAAEADSAARLAYLEGIARLPVDTRNDLRANVVASLNADQPEDVRKAAMAALASVPAKAGDSFDQLAAFFPQAAFRNQAVSSLLSIAAKSRGTKTSATLVQQLVEFAEATPAKDRTSDSFLNAMQLADELLTKLPSADAKSYRNRLGEITVRVIKLHTVEEEMRYDKPFFVVEAGRPVQVILDNEDLMPHNLVITNPEQLEAVALEGAALGTTPGKDGKLYVPESNDVLFSTTMVNAGKKETLTFNAPTEPGEYPYVCTFPRHWMRMYGVMKVVPDLDAWNRNPVEPKDPLGNTRAFVKSWKPADFPKDSLAAKLEAQNASAGAALFKEATCLSCHKFKGQGGAVGPELTDVMKRWKGDHYGILREILEPSYKIDQKYAVKIIIDIDGRTISGIAVAEDKSSISLLENPEAKEPRVIQKDDIDDIVNSSTSMMPKALLDKFTEEEILQLLAYITAE